MSRIINIATSVPSFRHSQADIASFMGSACEHEGVDADFSRKLKLLYERSGIESRYSVLPDFSPENEEGIFFPGTNGERTWPDVQQRMEFYNSKALDLAVKSIEGSMTDAIGLGQISHLITVSCTGISAPGLDIDIIEHFDLDRGLNRTSVNFMGCYAAIHALKQADYICKSDTDAVVLVICVELCTLHFLNEADTNNMTANMLFADGAASCLVIGDNVARSHKELKGFDINGFYSELAFNGKKDMAWNITAKGFQMVLSTFIPQLIKQDISALLQNALDKFNVQKSDIHHWAVHPGGKKILEVICSELGLQQNDLQSSFEILRNFGNMSSATILFVMKDILMKNGSSNGKTFGVAFGPGLTLESMLLTNV